MADTTSASDFAAVTRRLDDVEGWLTLDQAEVLFTAARSLGPGARIVEIGSFRGRSTTVLGLAAVDGVEVVAIDPHAGNDRGPNELEGFGVEAGADHDVFQRNLARAGLDGRVVHLRVGSQEALGLVAGPVELVFVDGAHRYRAALADLRGWGARVASGGTLLVHDAFSSVGVTAAIVRALLFSRSLRYEGRVGSLARYSAAPVEARGARLSNVWRQVAELPWFACNLLVKALILAGLGRVAAKLLGHREATWPY